MADNNLHDLTHNLHEKRLEITSKYCQPIQSTSTSALSPSSSTSTKSKKKSSSKQRLTDDDRRSSSRDSSVDERRRQSGDVQTLKSSADNHRLPPDGEEDFANLVCTSKSNEEFSKIQRRRKGLDQPNNIFPGLCLGASMFQSNSMMKFNIIGNEIHNIINVQLKRVRKFYTINLNRKFVELKIRR